MDWLACVALSQPGLQQSYSNRGELMSRLRAENISSGDGVGVAFTTIQTDAGTFPVATNAADTLTVTGGASGAIKTTGNSATDTVTYTLNALPANIALTMPVFNAGNSGSTLIFDWNNGPYQRCALTATCAFGFSNAVDGAVYQIEITQGVSGFPVTYPASLVTYAGGYSLIPAVTTANAALDLANLAYNGNATKYRLTIAQNFS